MRKLDWFEIAVLALSVVYVAFALSPSSYAIVLHALGAGDTGLLLGTPRHIRSDEWAVWTPYVQIAVNNGFARFDALSPYHEDLRNFNGLPLLDWALPFKPQFWLFFVGDPAYAFSFSHAFFIVAFLIGYHRLFQDFGFPKSWSAAASLLLFFTSYAQFWWTTTGPAMAFFPWLMISLLAPLRWPLKAALFSYLGTAWLLAQLYPPILISLAFAGACLAIAFRPDVLRSSTLLAGALGGGVAVALTYLYLRDAFWIMADTVYPGHRVVDGGHFPLVLWASHLFPFLANDFEQPIMPGWNICEVGTGGSWIALLTVILIDHRSLFGRLRERSAEAWQLRLRIGLPFLGVALISAWMLLPIPAGIGRLLLWDKVPAARMVFALGLLWVCWSMALLRAVPLRVTVPRLAVIAGLIVVAWLGSVDGASLSPVLASLELLLLPLLALLAYGVRRWPGQGKALLIGSAALCNVVAFGWFNPLQRSGPLFDRPETPITQALLVQQARSPNNILVATLPPFTGSVLAGWGFRSLAQTLVMPQLDFFRRYFPDMPERAFNQTFNRYAHVIPADVREPHSPFPDQLLVPVSAFGGPADPVAPRVELVPDLSGPERTGGHIDSVRSGHSTVITGWAWTSNAGEAPMLRIRAPATASVVSVAAKLRTDVISAFKEPRLAFSGFEVVVNGLAPDQLSELCIVSSDPIFGSRAVEGPDGRNNCALLPAQPR